MDMFLQQMSTLSWAFTEIGIQYLFVVAVTLAAGMAYTAIRDLMPFGRKMPASCKATIRVRQDK